MARGWESKSVEQQQADAVDQSKSVRPRLSPEEQKRNRQRDTLLLSRKRLLSQLDSASRSEHREMLQQSISEIDKQLSSFDKDVGPPAPK